MGFRAWGFAVALGAVLLLSGCADPVPESSPSVEPAGSEPTSGQETPANQWLLDLPRPYSSRVSSGAEPMILADRDAKYLWIGDTEGIWTSEDGGQKWRRSSPFGTLCDGIGLSQDETGRLWATNTGCSYVQFATSTDGAKTWSTGMLPQGIQDVSPVADRPWIAARGKSEATIIYYDSKYLGETCLRTTDSGSTWLDRGLGPLRPGAGNAVYDEKGRLHYAVGSTVYRYPASCLGGAESFDVAGGAVGVQNFDVLDIDGTQVFLPLPSADNKKVILWGTKELQNRKRLEVSPPELASNTFVTVSADDGQVAVAWYGSETPGNPGDRGYQGSWNVFVALVRDFWSDEPAITYYRLTDEPNHVGQFCTSGITCTASDDRDLLDYFGVDLDPQGGIHVAYGHDGRGSSAEVRYAYVAPGDPGGLTVVPTTGATNLPPILDFQLRVRGLAVSADASASQDPEGGALTYRWEWGDGLFSDEGPLTNHTYERSGNYTVTLTIQDPDGAQAARPLVVRVAPGVVNDTGTGPSDSPPAAPQGGGSNVPGPAVAAIAAALVLVAFARRRLKG